MLSDRYQTKHRTDPQMFSIDIEQLIEHLIRLIYNSMQTDLHGWVVLAIEALILHFLMRGMYINHSFLRLLTDSMTQ